MWQFILLTSLAFAAIDYDTPFKPFEANSLGTTVFNTPFELEFDIKVDSGSKPNILRSVLSYGDANKGLAVFLAPKSTKLLIKMPTDKSKSEACAPKMVLPTNKWITVRMVVREKGLIVSINDAPTKCTFKNGGKWLSPGIKPVYSCKAGQRCFKGQLREVEGFNNLPPLFSQCAKLKTMYASKKQQLTASIAKATQILPKHNKSLMAHKKTCEQTSDLHKLCEKLKTLARKTVNAVLKLVLKIQKDCSTGQKKAKAAISETNGLKTESETQLKQLEKNKVDCKCASDKAAMAGPIAQYKQKILNIDNSNPMLMRAIAMCRAQLTTLNAAKKKATSVFALPMFMWLKASMEAMYNKQIAVVVAQKKYLESLIRANERHKSQYLIFIKAKEAEMKNCQAKMRSTKLALAFLYEDNELQSLMQELNFDAMEEAELWEENTTLEAFEKDDMNSNQDARVSTLKVDYGLVGGASVLTSGLFYYAYTTK